MIRLNWHLFANHSGYSQAAQDMVLALSQDQRFDISVEFIGGKPTRPAISDQRYAYLMNLEKKDKNNRICVLHCIPTFISMIKPQKCQKKIGFATFETFGPPKQWINLLNQDNAVIVPSQFNYRVFANAGVSKPLFYIPHCIDLNKFNSDVIPLEKRDRFTFLFLGSWRQRKGYDLLIEAWLRGFSHQSDCQLLIKTDKTATAKKYVDGISKNLGLTKEEIGPIIYENKIFSDEDLPRFMKSVHCLISPSLGEGFYLPGCQSMFLGVPVIITNFSGCQEYATQDTATLLEPEVFVLKKCMDNISQFNNCKWAMVSIESIIKAMKDVKDNYSQKLLKAKSAQTFVSQKFTYPIIADMTYDMLETLNA